MYHAAVFGADGEFAAVIGFPNSLQIKNFPLFFSLEEKEGNFVSTFVGNDFRKREEVPD